MLRLVVYGFAIVHTQRIANDPIGHADVPASLYTPTLLRERLNLPPAGPLYLHVLQAVLVLSALVAATGRLPRLAGWVCFLAVLDWQTNNFCLRQVRPRQLRPRRGARGAADGRARVVAAVADAGRRRAGRLGAARRAARRRRQLLPGRAGQVPVRWPAVGQRRHVLVGLLAPRKRPGTGARGSAGRAGRGPVDGAAGRAHLARDAVAARALDLVRGGVLGLVPPADLPGHRHPLHGARGVPGRVRAR